MSITTENSPQHCADDEGTVITRKIWFIFSSIFFSILAFILVVWVILHPKKPEFSMKEADVNQVIIYGPYILNSSIQLTLMSSNPNNKVGIYYDQFFVHAAYRGQQITPVASVSPFFQDHDEKNLLSASLVGTQVPVASTFRDNVLKDQMTGRMPLTVKVMGKLRWKVGTWTSGRSRFVVNCVTILHLPSSTPPPSTQGSRCTATL